MPRSLVLFDRWTTAGKPESRMAPRRFRKSMPAFLRTASVRNLATAPVVYSLVIPLVLADLARGPGLRAVLRGTQPSVPGGWIGLSAGPRARASRRRSG